jgi:6,7-dimethyl-8-ribityllumazine synthase
MARYDIPPGSYDPGDAGFAVVAARFNHAVVDRLVEGALHALASNGVETQRIHLMRVPGAFELPVTARLVGRRDDVAAVLALGCVIRGGTPHFEYVCAETARGIGQVALDLCKPIIFGVLTTDTAEQADARAGGAHGNKGEEAALAALEMVTLIRRLQDGSP